MYLGKLVAMIRQFEDLEREIESIQQTIDDLKSVNGHTDIDERKLKEKQQLFNILYSEEIE